MIPSTSQFGIPDPDPKQRPIRKPRSPQAVTQFRRSRHSGAAVADGTDGREAEREYTPDQVFQTLAWGHEHADPKGDPDVRHFTLDSIAHAQMRRRIVANVVNRTVITTYPREPIAEPAPARPSIAQKAADTKKKQREQKLRKQQRSRQANGDS